MIKKIHITYAVDYIAAIIVILIQPQMLDYSRNFIVDIFVHPGFGLIIILLSVITYSLYFGNSRLSFIVGFLSTITPLVHSPIVHFYLTPTIFISQEAKFLAVLGVIFGLIGMLFSIFKKNADISTRISIHAALLMSILGIPAVLNGLGLGLELYLILWSVFNPALIAELLLSYLILRDVKEAFIFTVSALIMTLLIIIITPLYSVIHAPHFVWEYLFFGIIIAIILSAILRAYTYYQAHKTRS